jgi:signal peptidase I
MDARSGRQPPRRFLARKDEPPEKARPRAILGERSFVYDLLGAAIILLILIGSLYTYTGNWPPLVVVQSGSMMHSQDKSYIGAIDTGDLVFVKSLGEDERIVPYVEGMKKDHRTYGSWGDVIIFKPNGEEDRTAIIHRSVIFIKFNETTYDPQTMEGGAYDVPALGLTHVSNSFTIDDYEWPKDPKNDLEIDIDRILENFKAIDRKPHDGYITKGDGNLAIDQTVTFPGNEYLLPVKEDWIIGKSRGELPWFGIIKLKIEGKSDAPQNSVRYLVFAVIFLVVAPFLIDLALHAVLGKTKKVAREEEGENERAPKKPSSVRLPPRRRQ